MKSSEISQKARGCLITIFKIEKRREEKGQNELKVPEVEFPQLTGMGNKLFQPE